ncbi:MAG: hypothetical protein BWY31_04478 [Lentisphaerae bacterium ADurb.Bin242]|nr:MAG: hypothetical protein BWY31_04478 [Lentisphaerae bacterium ADurb.Bin242]
MNHGNCTNPLLHRAGPRTAFCARRGPARHHPAAVEPEHSVAGKRARRSASFPLQQMEGVPHRRRESVSAGSGKTAPPAPVCGESGAGRRQGGMRTPDHRRDFLDARESGVHRHARRHAEAVSESHRGSNRLHLGRSDRADPGTNHGPGPDASFAGAFQRRRTGL